MTAGTRMASSLFALRHMISLESVILERKRHTHVVKKSERNSILLRHIMLELLSSYVAQSDVQSEATFSFSLPDAIPCNLDISFDGTLVASVVLGVSESYALGQIESQIENFYSVLGETVTVSSSAGVVTISGPPSMNGTVITSALSSCTGYESPISGVTDFCGGFYAGEINAPFAEEANDIYQYLVQYYNNNNCCDGPIAMLDVCAEPAAAPTEVGPVAAFTASIGGGQDIRDFDGTASINNDGVGVTADLIFFWEFGNGSTDGPTVGLQNTSHTYVSDGTFAACLTVTDSNGNSHKTCSTIVIDTGGVGIGSMVIEGDNIVG